MALELQTKTPDLPSLVVPPELLLAQAECMLLQAEYWWAMAPEMESTPALRDLSPLGR